MRFLVFVAAACLLGACIPSEGPMMKPGQNCMDCHSGSEDAPSFTAAGTVFMNPGDDPSQGIRGARIHLTDANGRSLTLKSNDAGNFYTREKLEFPLQVTVERDGLLAVMTTPAPEGACNKCHTVPPPASQLPDRPAGRIALVGGIAGDEFMLPGYDCQSCHRPGGQASGHPWNASGTVFASRAGGAGDEGVTVTIVDAQGRTFQGVTNRVGNFYLPDAIAFGGSARVSISKGGVTRTMNEQLPHGSCNACHFPGGEGEGRVSLAGGGD